MTRPAMTTIRSRGRAVRFGDGRRFWNTGPMGAPPAPEVGAPWDMHGRLLQSPPVQAWGLPGIAVGHHLR